MPLDLRVAGALVLVYGLKLSRIAYLTRDDVIDRDGQTWLRHHGHQLLVPPRLATLIRQLAGQPRPPAHRTDRHAITGHPARDSAIGALAAELPAPVLADITGMNITTATSWTHSTGRDWTRYLEARTQGQ